MNENLAIRLEEYLGNLSETEKEIIITESTKYIIKELEKEKQLTL